MKYYVQRGQDFGGSLWHSFMQVLIWIHNIKKALAVLLIYRSFDFFVKYCIHHCALHLSQVTGILICVIMCTLVN